MTNSNEKPIIDPREDEETQIRPPTLKHEIERHVEAMNKKLVNVVAVVGRGGLLVLKDLKLEEEGGGGLTLVGTNQNGGRFAVPWKDFDSVVLKPKED